MHNIGFLILDFYCPQATDFMLSFFLECCQENTFSEVMIKFLKTIAFALKSSMPGLDPTLLTHRTFIKTDCSCLSDSYSRTSCT